MKRSKHLRIEDGATITLIERLAALRCVSMQDAVKVAVRAELDRSEAMPLRERFARLRAEHPLPPPTGEKADKAFFDDLSGEP